jgi:hypothetical protein
MPIQINGTDALVEAAEAIAIRDAILDDATRFSGALIKGIGVLVPTTIELNQVAASYTLYTGTTQPVELLSLVIRMPAVTVVGTGVTSISIQTEDTTPQTFVTAVEGAVANLTAEAQISWSPSGGICYIGVGTLIQLTIAGAAAGDSRICNVVACYRPIVTGGTLVP